MKNYIEKGLATSEELLENGVCAECYGVGFYTVDTMTNGEHSQYEQRCECKIKGDDNETDNSD